MVAGGCHEAAQLGPCAARLVHAPLRHPSAAGAAQWCHSRHHHSVLSRLEGGVDTARGGTPNRGAGPARDRRAWQALRRHVLDAATRARLGAGHVARGMMRDGTLHVIFVACGHMDSPQLHATQNWKCTSCMPHVTIWRTSRTASVPYLVACHARLPMNPLNFLARKQ